MNPRWLLRAAKVARNPPSWRMVLFGGCVIAAALALGAVEHWVGWPDWLTVPNDMRRPGR